MTSGPPFPSLRHGKVEGFSFGLRKIFAGGWKETCVTSLPPLCHEKVKGWCLDFEKCSEKLHVGLRTHGCNSTRDTMPGAFSFHRFASAVLVL